MTHEELLHAFQSIKDITGPNVFVLIEYAINSNLSISDCIRLRGILSDKINEYKKSLIDKYQQAANEVARKRKIDILPIPDKHLKDIENRIKLHTINLCGIFNLIIAELQGEDSSELKRLQDMEMTVLKSIIFKFDNELKKKHYTLYDTSRERRTHKNYIIESKKPGREISPGVYAQLNSLDLLEEDIKIKHPVSCLANTHAEFQKFDYIHIALICHYAKIIEDEKLKEFMQRFDKTKGPEIPKKFRERLNFFSHKKNRIDFDKGRKSGLHLSKTLQDVIEYLKINELSTSEAESDLIQLSDEIERA